MASRVHFVLSLLASTASLIEADELAWGDVNADGTLNLRSLDTPVATARGADNLYIPNPMDSHDWSRAVVVRNTLASEMKNTAKLKNLEDKLRPIFSVMPKDVEGRLSNGTARYALHRYFRQKHGWSIKGLEPAGASWWSQIIITPAVKDLSKYMIPSYLQQVLTERLGVSGWDLHNLAIFTAVIDHLIHAEMLALVYSIFTTLELSIPGTKTQKEVSDILDAFMMVFAFGINLDVSNLADVQKAKTHLQEVHSGWPEVQHFAKEVQQGSGLATSELTFDQIVHLVEKIIQGYAQWQGQDCSRVKQELVSKPSHREGRVPFSELSASHAAGRRQLLTESYEELSMLGVMSEGAQAEPQLIIPNYMNSKSMCLSTASLFTVCCVNECTDLLDRLETEAAGPAVSSDKLSQLVKAMPGASIAEHLLQQLPSLADTNTGLIPLHGLAFAGWMHRAFPLACPAPNEQTTAPQNQTITNPQTPNEWMSENGTQVLELQEMIAKVAGVLGRYATMGKNMTRTRKPIKNLTWFTTDSLGETWLAKGQKDYWVAQVQKNGVDVFAAEEEASNASRDVDRIRTFIPQELHESGLIGTISRLAAVISAVSLLVFIKSGLLAPVLFGRSSKSEASVDDLPFA